MGVRTRALRIFHNLFPPCSVVTDSDYKYLETLAKNITKEKQPFERLLASKEDLLEMFKVGRD